MKGSICLPEFERILNGESAAMLAPDAQLGKLHLV